MGQCHALEPGRKTYIRLLRVWAWGRCVVGEAVPRYLTQHEGMILVDICSVLILSGAHLSANARSVHAWSETTHAGNMALCSTAW